MKKQRNTGARMVTLPEQGLIKPDRKQEQS